MSKQTALGHLGLKRPAAIGHTEYSIEYHRRFLADRTGLSARHPELLARGYDALGIDLLWHTDDGLIDWAQAGRVTDMGHAAWSPDGSDLREPEESPFSGEKEVWAFDAVGEYGLPDPGRQTAAYAESLRRMSGQFSGQLVPGGIYRTIVSGAAAAFGWENLLLAASDPAKMERVFDSFFRRSIFFLSAWARTDAEAVIVHDDFVWESGPFMNLDIYRCILLPRYRHLFSILHDAGKKAIFCSDGDFREFAEDLIAAGADALIVEPSVFPFVAAHFLNDVCLIGSMVDCRDLADGKWEKVRADIDRTLELFAGAKGAIFAVGNHLAPSVSDEMLGRFFDYLLPRLQPGSCQSLSDA